MSELITKEELLELGFILRANVLDDGFYYRSNHNKYCVVANLIDNECSIINKDVTLVQDQIIDNYDATKTNVLKLIEIAKLIGELE